MLISQRKILDLRTEAQETMIPTIKEKVALIEESN